jgi:uncharacterized membrane protein YkvA (DUF1232 family)
MGTMPQAIAQLKAAAKRLKQETFVLYLACRDPRVPWYAKVLGVCVVAYAFSPIDLVPDFIPVLGLLDDLLIVPLGIALTLKLIPEPVLADCRERAEALRQQGKPTSWVAGAVIVALWIAGAAACARMVWRRVPHG